MTIPAKAKQLLDFIRSIEAPAGDHVIFGNRQSALKKPITSMTVDEVIAAQKTWSTKAWAKKFKSIKASSAAGGLQFMRPTLLGLKKDGKCRGDEIFDSDLQDRLGYALLQRRGFDRFVAGKMSRTAFALELAKEWASFPALRKTKGAHRMIERGQSYYAGDGLNKALVSPVRVEAALAALVGGKAEKPAERPSVPPDPAPGPQEPDFPETGDGKAEPQDPVAQEKPRKLRWSKRLWAWLSVMLTGGGMQSLREAGLLELDWTFWAIVAGFITAMSLIGIVTMPEVRRGLGRAIGRLLP